PLSIELFVKKGAVASTSTFFSYFVNLTFSSSNVVATAPGGCSRTSAALSAAGQFVEVVLTSSTLSLYLDGVLQGTSVTCTPTGSLPSTVTIYALSETTLEIDELRIWSSDQSSVFASGAYLARYLPASQQSLSTLIGYWNFDEGACGRTGSRATISTSACWSLSSAPLYPVFDVAQSSSVLITLDKLGADPESALKSLTIQVYNINTALGSLYDVNPALPAQTTGSPITTPFTVTTARLTNGLWFYCSSSATPGLSNLFSYNITDYAGSVASSGLVKVHVTATTVLPAPPQAQDLVVVFYSSANKLMTLPVNGQGTLMIQFPSAPAAGSISGVSTYPANLSTGVISFTYIFPTTGYQDLYNLTFPYTVCELSGTICSSANVILYRGELRAFDDALQVPNSEGFPYSFDSLLTNDWIY
ncbi:MAG: LamG domain-containing protein, partial [Prosthecobacter sp.]|nr:LamG domain-containing protein [Prosthecobacter sp.]